LQEKTFRLLMPETSWRMTAKCSFRWLTDLLSHSDRRLQRRQRQLKSIDKPSKTILHSTTDRLKSNQETSNEDGRSSVTAIQTILESWM
jgi:hypothetical protein